MAIASQLDQLSPQVRDLVKYLQQTTNPPIAPEHLATAAIPVQVIPIAKTGIKLPPPERFSGEPCHCKAFLIDCSIHFEHSSHAFTTDRSKIGFTVSHLTGRARAWVTAEWNCDSPLCSSLQEFQAVLMKTFDPVSTDREEAKELSGLRQGSGSVCDYAIHFRTLAAESGWNATALYDVFLRVQFQFGSSLCSWTFLQTRTPSSPWPSGQTTQCTNSISIGEAKHQPERSQRSLASVITAWLESQHSTPEQ